MRLTIKLDDCEVEIFSGSHVFVSNAYTDEYYDWPEVTETVLADAVQRAEDLLLTYKARKREALLAEASTRADRLPLLPKMMGWY